MGCPDVTIAKSTTFQWRANKENSELGFFILPLCRLLEKSGKTETQLEGRQVLGVLFVLACAVPLYRGVCVYFCVRALWLLCMQCQTQSATKPIVC